MQSKTIRGTNMFSFSPRDWVWVHMRKERFPAHRKSKLQPRGDGPFLILERINDNENKRIQRAWRVNTIDS